MNEEGWRFVAFTRLVPRFPLFQLNYALDLKRIHIRHSLFPGHLCVYASRGLHLYVGYAGREVTEGDQRLIQRNPFAPRADGRNCYAPALPQAPLPGKKLHDKPLGFV